MSDPDAASLATLENELRSSGLVLHVLDETQAMRRVRSRTPLRVHDSYLARWLDFARHFARPGEPHALVLPTNAIFFQFLNVYRVAHRFSKPDLGAEVASLLAGRQQPAVLLATGDYGQRSRSPWESHARGRAYPRLYDWLDERMVLAAFESTSALAPQDLRLLPYVLDPVPVSFPERDLLFSFAGALSYKQLPAEHVRGCRLSALAGHGADWFIGSATQARTLYGGAGADTAMIGRSTFTLCPAGFGRWTFRFAQALQYGSIPVLLADGYVLPHADVVDWDSCCLVVPEGELDTLPDRLRSLPADEVERLQTGLRAHTHLFSERAVHLMAARQLARGLGLLG